MKTLFKLLLVTLWIGNTCFAQQGEKKSRYEDDIYYSPKDVKSSSAEQSAEKNSSSSSEKSTDKNSSSSESSTSHMERNSDQVTEKQADQKGNTYITNNYSVDHFNYDDYYDYEYAVRLRRFNHPCYGFGYYDDYYTNSYWYSYNPYHAGVSVYLGYNWWGSAYDIYSYSPGYYWNGGYYNYNYYYYPKYSYSYLGHSYRNGYNRGYANGYINGYNNGYTDNYYYNSYDKNNYYYGKRKTVSYSGKTVSSRPDFGQRYQEAVASEQRSRPDMNKRAAPPINTNGAVNNAKNETRSTDKSMQNPRIEPQRRNNNVPSSQSSPRPYERPRVNPTRPVEQKQQKQNEEPKQEYNGPGRRYVNPSAPDYNKPQPAPARQSNIPSPTRGSNESPVKRPRR